MKEEDGEDDEEGADVEEEKEEAAELPGLGAPHDDKSRTSLDAEDGVDSSCAS